jgi:hypothetical protein
MKISSNNNIAMFAGFDIYEEDPEYVIVDKEQNGHHNRHTVVLPSIKLNNEYEKLLHQNKIIATQLEKMVYSLEKAGVSGHKRNLWLDAANCLIKCMADLIEKGDELIKV